MKNSILALGCAAVCGLSLSSCVVDPYGVPVAGGFSSGPVYGNSGYYDSGYCAPTPVFAPAVSTFGIFGGGFGGGFGNSCNTSYGYGGSNYNSHHHTVSHGRPVSSSHAYASQVTRPSTFRGSPVYSSPPSIPNLPAPRTLSRPTFPSAPAAPSPSFSAPSRSFEAPSMPRPSGRADSGGGRVVSAPSSFSEGAGRFSAGLPSDRRRER
ncbi:MAG: hypothetical protein NTV80_05340 [Verrucomicrobia bacterium]|nr:hypothetical protein [Verrucomicrobiota bacterium]